MGVRGDFLAFGPRFKQASLLPGNTLPGEKTGNSDAKEKWKAQVIKIKEDDGLASLITNETGEMITSWSQVSTEAYPW